MNQALIDKMVQASVSRLVRTIREQMTTIVYSATEEQNANALINILATTVLTTIEEVASYGEGGNRNEICRRILSEVNARIQRVVDERWAV